MKSVVNTFPRHVQMIENVFIPLADGTRLAARIWLPEDAEANPVPVILEYLPYRKRDGTRWRDAGTHGYFAGHGYASVRVDIRGTGDSDGLIDDEYTLQEQLDGIEVINWLASQAWSTGDVAMIGISWGGFNGLQIAAHQPDALKTIITVGSTDDRYATDVHWVGGCLSKDNFDWSATMFAYNDLPPDPEIVGERWLSMWQERMAHNRPWILDWMAHQRRDAFWQQGSVCEDFSKITIPVYAVSGWADNYSEAVPRLLAGLSGPRLGLIGPWAHSYPHNVAVEPAIGWLQEAVRWFDHWLKGIDTGIMDEPMLRVWMQDWVPPKTCYAERPGRWVSEGVWPSGRIENQTFFLSAGQTLGPAPRPSDALTLCSPLWVGLGAGEVGRYGAAADWSTDQREDDGGSLVFITPPLGATCEILGAPVLRLSLSSDKPQALVSVRLNDVAPDGSSMRVTIGCLNLTHRDSHENPTALEPGKVYDVNVELDDIAHAFPAGHRIAVSISTTYWPIAWPSPELATLTLHTGQSALILPVRPERDDDRQLRVFGPAISAPEDPIIDHPVEASHIRSVTRDLLSGRMIVDFPRGNSVREMPDIGLTHKYDGLARYVIVDGDPLSAEIQTDFAVEIVRKDGVFGHKSVGRMSCDATHFIIEQSLEIHRDQALIFSRTWHERIARDMV